MGFLGSGGHHLIWPIRVYADEQAVRQDSRPRLPKLPLGASPPPALHLLALSRRFTQRFQRRSQAKLTKTDRYKLRMTFLGRLLTCYC